MLTRLSRISAAVLALSLTAAACASDDDSSTADNDTTATTEAMADDATTEAMADDAGTIVEVASNAGDFATLVAAVQAAGLVDTLNGAGPFTVFAPNDAAFAAALTDLDLTAEELLADTDLLTSVLTYHVVEGNVPAADVVTMDGQTVTTVNGADLTITVDGDTVMVNDATVIATDIAASNGVIHVIDSVLLPAS